MAMIKIQMRIIKMLRGKKLNKHLQICHQDLRIAQIKVCAMLRSCVKCGNAYEYDEDVHEVAD